MIMRHKKIIDLLKFRPNQLPKFRTNTWMEKYHQSKGLNNTNSDISFQTTMVSSSLCDYSDAYILVKGRAAIIGAGADTAARTANERNKGVIF